MNKIIGIFFYLVYNVFLEIVIFSEMCESKRGNLNVMGVGFFLKIRVRIFYIFLLFRYKLIIIIFLIFYKIFYFFFDKIIYNFKSNGYLIDCFFGMSSIFIGVNCIKFKDLFFLLLI